MKVSVFGAGYVGLIQAVGLASAGNSVVLVEISEEKIKLISEGKSPIFESGLSELLSKAISNQLLKIVSPRDPQCLSMLHDCQIDFLAVGTPEGPDGLADLSQLLASCEILSSLTGNLKERVIVVKSTVPVGTGDQLDIFFESKNKLPSIVSNPEFLKQGSALADFLKPERVIIGTKNEVAAELLKELYKPFMLKRERFVTMNRRSAELVKYACNSFLATKISFINEMAQLSEKLGANINEIRQGMITDSRIGDQFLFPGIGYGGSCLPKDTHSILAQAKKSQIPLRIIASADAVNNEQKIWAFHKLRHFYGESLKDKTVALWGLSFKPNTDDVRDAPSILLIKMLLEHGAKVKAHDPIAMESAHRLLTNEINSGRLTLVKDPYLAAEGADALVVYTEWHDYRSPDFQKLSSIMRQPIVLDGRNIYTAMALEKHQLKYFGVGLG